MGQRGQLSEIKSRAIAAGIAAGLVCAMGVLTLSQTKAEAKPMMLVMPSLPSPLVTRIVGSPDQNKARQDLLAVYHRNELLSGADYRAAALLFEKSSDEKDLMMAHDFAIASLALGDGESRPIVARTEDRLFQVAGLGERYGTLGGKSPLTESHRRLLARIQPTGVSSPSLQPIAAPAG